MSTSSHPRPERPFGRVSILGLGLMGGSLARALSALPEAPTVRGWTAADQDRAAAARSGALAEVTDSASAVLSEADLVVLAVPLSASLELLELVAREAPADATVTDLGSLKAPVADAARAAGLASRWVGSHPMAGSEASGFAASAADLYQGSCVWTVAWPEAEGRVGGVHAVWGLVGARPARIDAVAHDRLMALVSHLPQLTSNALASVLAAEGIAPERLGPGGRDMTRLSASNDAMWRDLLSAAPPELARSLRALSVSAARLAELIEEGRVDEIGRLMRETARWKTGS